MLKLLLLLFLIGCQTTKPDPDKLYRKDMSLTVNGISGRGVLVAPASGFDYVIEGYLKTVANYLEIDTCHRYDLLEEQGEEFVYGYHQDEAIEGSGLCYLKIAGLNNAGYHSWGLVEFINDEESLQAEISCNGAFNQTTGVSVCQSRVGKTQGIGFAERVRVRSTCGQTVKTTDQKNFTYDIPRGLCSFLFTSLEGKHRHTSFGFDEVLLKGY